MVVLVLDGLGWSMLERHADALPTLGAMAGGAITTVVPSTTAAALTSITTGVPPAGHGIVGYRFRVGGEVLNTLRWQYDGGTRAPKPAEVQPVEPFTGHDVPVVSKAEFATTGFTTAHLRGASLYGWRTPANIVTHCRELVRAGHTLVYAYYDGIDKIAHAEGLDSDFLSDELRASDHLVAHLLEALPRDSALLVTADHGQVQVGVSGQHSIEDLAPMIGSYSGEGRFRSLHARPGAVGDLLDAARERFGDVAWVRSREEVMAAGWLGPNPGLTVSGRIGDVILAPWEPIAFVDPGYEQETRLQSMHGSLTADEMLVPLIAGSGVSARRGG